MYKKESWNDRHPNFQVPESGLIQSNRKETQKTEIQPGDPSGCLGIEYRLISDDDRTDKPRLDIPIYWKAGENVHLCEFTSNEKPDPGTYPYTLNVSRSGNPHPSKNNTVELIKESTVKGHKFCTANDGCYYYGSYAASMIAQLVNDAPEGTTFVDFSLFETTPGVAELQEIVVMRFWKAEFPIVQVRQEVNRSQQLIVSDQIEKEALFSALESTLHDHTNEEALYDDSPTDEQLAKANVKRNIMKRLIASMGIDAATYAPAESWLKMGLVEFVPDEKLKEIASLDYEGWTDPNRDQILIAKYFLKKKLGIDTATSAPGNLLLDLALKGLVPDEKLREIATLKNPIDRDQDRVTIAKYFLEKKTQNTQNPESHIVQEEQETNHSGQTVIFNQAEKDILFEILWKTLRYKTRSCIYQIQTEEQSARTNALRDIIRRLIANMGIDATTYASPVEWLRLGLVEFVPDEELKEIASPELNPSRNLRNFEPNIARYFLNQKNKK